MVASHYNPSEHDLELLSAYLDGELSDREAAELERRLRREPALLAVLEDMRATITLLNELPVLKAPRNFTLDPARYSRPTPWWSRLFTVTNVLQLSGALGAVASVLLIVGVLLLSRTADREDEARDSAAQPAIAQDSVNETQAEEFASSPLGESDASAVPQVALVPTGTSAPVPATGLDAAPENESTAIAYSGEGLIQTTIVAQSTFFFSTDTWHTSTAEALAYHPTMVPATGTPPVPVEGAAANQTAEQSVFAASPADVEAPAAIETDGAADFSDSDMVDGAMPPPQPNAEAQVTAPQGEPVGDPAALEVASGVGDASDDTASSVNGPQEAGVVSSTGDAMREPEGTPMIGGVEQKLPTPTSKELTSTPTVTRTSMPLPTATKRLRLTDTPLLSLEPSPAAVGQSGSASDMDEAASEPMERAKSADTDGDFQWLAVVGFVTLFGSLAVLVWGRLRVRRT